MCLQKINKIKFIITDDFLCLHMCVYLWLDIYTNLYRFIYHTEACVFLFIFFKNTDGFINISRIHFFHLEKQQQEKQHLMMNMYTFSRHAAFFAPIHANKIHISRKRWWRKKCENLPLVDDWGAFVENLMTFCNGFFQIWKF